MKDIDVIIAYVNNNDPVWKKEYEQYKDINKENSFDERNGENRYRDTNTLKFLLRGVEQNMPWVRKVFLVVSGPTQVPNWIDKSCDKLKIIYHKDYIPERFLPTFNANTIECFFWRIEELSENFIYFNDDIIPIKELYASDFFIDDKPRCNVYIRKTDSTKYWNIMWENCLKFGFIKHKSLFNDGGYYIATDHGPTPLRKSSMKILFNYYGEDLLKTFTTVRDECNVTQYLFVAYELDSGNLKTTRIQNKYNFYSDTKTLTLKQYNSVFGYDCICVSDKLEDDFNKKVYANTLFFEMAFPLRSSFEKPYLNEDKLVSVIVPVHNGEIYIKDFLTDLQKQTYKNLEIIIVDNGSSDDGYKIVEDFQKTDDRIKLYRIDKVSLSNARNYGMSVCKGDYVCFSDIDDKNGNRRIECSVDYLNSHENENFVGTLMQTIDIDGTLWRKDAYGNYGYHDIRFLCTNYADPCHVCNVLYRKSFIDNFSFFETPFDEDVCFSYETIISNGYFPCVNYVGYFYKKQINSMTDKVLNKGIIPREDIEKYINMLYCFVQKYKDADDSIVHLVKRVIGRHFQYKIEKFNMLDLS